MRGARRGGGRDANRALRGASFRVGLPWGDRGGRLERENTAGTAGPWDRQERLAPGWKGGGGAGGSPGSEGGREGKSR